MEGRKGRGEAGVGAPLCEPPPPPAGSPRPPAAERPPGGRPRSMCRRRRPARTAAPSSRRRRAGGRAAPGRCLLTWQPGRAPPARPSALCPGPSRGEAAARSGAGCAADRPRARLCCSTPRARRTLSFRSGRRRAGQGEAKRAGRRRRHGGCAAPGAPPHCSVSRNPSRERQPITPGPPPSLAAGRGDGRRQPIAPRPPWVEPPLRPRPSRGRAVPDRPVGRGRRGGARGASPLHGGRLRRGHGERGAPRRGAGPARGCQGGWELGALCRCRARRCAALPLRRALPAEPRRWPGCVAGGERTVRVRR